MDCEVCGEPVRAEIDEEAVIFEFKNFAPAYTENYGFCPRHQPDDFDVVKQRIRLGKSPMDNPEMSFGDI